MLRDILSSKMLIAGFVFFVVIVGGSLLYSWHVRRTTDAELALTQQAVLRLKNKNEAHTAADAKIPTDTETPGERNTPAETDETLMSAETAAFPMDETDVLDWADAFLPDEAEPEKDTAEEVPVSPYGFGPYPEVPADFPGGTPMWEQDLDALGFSEAEKRNSELLSRVLIKLWVEHGIGSRLGGHIDNNTGRVYPHLENTIYVRRRVHRNPDGTEGATVAEMSVPGNMFLTGEEVEQFRETGATPPGLQVLQLDTDGIDPYEFLNLQR